jgi:hypothetical protein
MTRFGPPPSHYSMDQRAERQPLPSLTTGYHQPRSNGHSTGSSLSSAFSEPTSPHSLPGHPYSPARHYAERSNPEMRERSASNLPFPSRDEPLPHFHPFHSRSQTVPTISGPQPAPPGSLPAFGAYGHHIPPQPMHPVHDPFHVNRGSFATQQPLPPGFQHEPRPRFDSAMQHCVIPQEHYGPPQYYSNMPNQNFARKRRGNLPKESTKVLREWFRQHEDSPYPSEDEKTELCKQTSLAMSQVCSSVFSFRIVFTELSLWDMPLEESF